MNGVADHTPRTLHEALRSGVERLEQAGVTDAEIDARLLLEYATNTDRWYFSLHRHENMDPSDAELYDYLLTRRADRVPLQYITGEAAFFGETFYVTEDVLIPRQDTEILVEEAGKRLEAGEHVLDLCTGSGCILLTLVRLYSVTGVGVDLSPAALAVAEHNRRHQRLRATWVESDLFNRVGGTFDMIVCNPPYVTSAELAELEPEVRGHEPMLALHGGKDGLDLIRRIVREAPRYLRPEGHLLMEIGAGQGKAVAELFTKNGFTEVVVVPDLAGRDRVVAGKKDGI